MSYSILGASGFIGARLVGALRDAGYDCDAYSHKEEARLSGRLGHVIDCVGVTSDFRERPFDAVRAHVGRVMDLIERCQFDSYLYLSSTTPDYARYERKAESLESISRFVPRIGKR